MKNFDQLTRRQQIDVLEWHSRHGTPHGRFEEWLKKSTGKEGRDWTNKCDEGLDCGGTENSPITGRPAAPHKD